MISRELRWPPNCTDKRQRPGRPCPRFRLPSKTNQPHVTSADAGTRRVAIPQQGAIWILKKLERVRPLTSPDRAEASKGRPERAPDPLDSHRYFDPATERRLDDRERCSRPSCEQWTAPHRKRTVRKGKYRGWTRCWFRCCGEEWTNIHEPLEFVEVPHCLKWDEPERAHN
jgi:hypothetical protein